MQIIDNRTAYAYRDFLALAGIIELIMIIFTFGNKNIVENTFYFYVITIIIGGCQYMLTGSAYKVNIVMMIIISPIILGIYIYAMRKYKVDLKKIYDCIIIDKDNTYNLKGYMDTGNNLIDPITNLPVIMVNNKIKVGMVGISFGMEFIPIYMKHPDVYEIAIADTNLELIKTAQEKFGISSKDCYDNYDDMLKDDAIDAIHIVTPPSTHAEFSIKALKAGKHCGCTIPMGMSIQELEDVIKARMESQKQYMFMETTVFGREYFYVKDLLDQGKFGKIQYMTCAHYQDMEGWPSYWEGFPPLMHPTHAIGTCLMLLNDYPKEVYAKGSGRIRDELISQYHSPFAFEAAFVTMEHSDVAIEMERFLYGVARSYSECFRIYGRDMSFE